ncbi:MAG: FlgO family outer membrane protein [Verrucomicrobiota bacterium]|nr:FlgO family outer membrane protein [Verrucomicrobiota bacterium]
MNRSAPHFQDSLVEQKEDSVRCEQCGAKTRVESGICVNCFLLEGLSAAGDGCAETFSDVLDEVDLPDLHRQIGNYEILEGIGRGGMGVIYRARQRHTRRIVALKRVLAYQAESPEALVRFRREAEAVASLDHPNILPIYEVGQGEDGLPFFSMRYASGGSLRDAAAQLQDRPNECVRLMAKVARAIDYAHRQGILHRDLQPGNILLDEHDEPLVSDFGLAKWLTESSDLTRTLTTFGTPGYIAPEQAESAAGDLTPAADVYSLGAVLFHLLAGRPPFVGENVLSVLRQASLEPAPKLRSLAPSLDRDLETICARCLERDPTARYQSAGDLAADLERWLEGRPIVARPVTSPVRLWRWSRRNPILAGAAAACFLLGATILWMLPNQAGWQPLPPLEKSVAVLPFKNLSPEQKIAVFADAVQNQILTDLAKVADLKVISRTSVMQYKAGATRNLKDIARELGVAYVVEGSAQREGERVRVTAQLIDARTDAHVWAETYERQLADVFAIQSEIAQKISQQLGAKLSPQERTAMASRPTQNIKAFEDYTRARALLDTLEDHPTYEENQNKAIGLLEQAVAKDPQFALAYSVLAEVKMEKIGGTKEDKAEAKAALQEAQRLAPEAGETIFAQAFYEYSVDRDFDRALATLELAARALPNNAQIYWLRGLVERRLGRWDECLRHLKRAIELNPKDGFVRLRALETASLLRRSGEAQRIADAAIAAIPVQADIFRESKGEVSADEGDLAAARRQLDSIERKDIRGGSPYLAFVVPLYERNYRAAAQVAEGRPNDDRHDGRAAFLAWLANGGQTLSKSQHDAIEEALGRVTEKLAKQPDDSGWELSRGARLNAALGNKTDAIRMAKRAVELVPVSEDAYGGGFRLEALALVYAKTGEKDLAFEVLSTLVKMRGWAASYGALKFDPQWDNLRGDPRFDDLLAQAAKPIE